MTMALLAPLAAAQENLGALLDAGARKLSAEEFQQEVVQRAVVGPSGTGGSIEVVYTGNGIVQGIGTLPNVSPTRGWVHSVQISGLWTIDESERVCTSMRLSLSGGGAAGGAALGTYLPPRCQFWLKLSDKYFLSDSDSDRSAKVLSRTLKQ
jgi:hypothetical protein